MYECEQTGKDEYDSSKKEDEQEPEATGSIFQGLRAASSRANIVDVDSSGGSGQKEKASSPTRDRCCFRGIKMPRGSCKVQSTSI